MRRHEEIVGEMVWQNGVHLRSQCYAAEALLQADYHERRLTMWVRGEQAARYFEVLHEGVLQILQRMEELPFDEFVYLPESARIGEAPPGMLGVAARFDYRDLLAKEAAGESKIVCKFGTYDLAAVLRVMRPKDETRTVNHNYNGPCFDQKNQQVGNQNNADNIFHGVQNPAEFHAVWQQLQQKIQAGLAQESFEEEAAIGVGADLQRVSLEAKKLQAAKPEADAAKLIRHLQSIQAATQEARLPLLSEDLAQAIATAQKLW